MFNDPYMTLYILGIVGAVAFVGLIILLIIWWQRNAPSKGAKMASHPVDEQTPAPSEVTTQEIPVQTMQTQEQVVESPGKSNEFGLQLIVDDSGETFDLVLPTTIGRSKDNSIVLHHESVSDIHARIDEDRDLEIIYIEDLDSLNGIYVNNLPTRKNILQDGVKITLGTVTLTYRDNGYLFTE